MFIQQLNRPVDTFLQDHFFPPERGLLPIRLDALFNETHHFQDARKMKKCVLDQEMLRLANAPRVEEKKCPTYILQCWQIPNTGVFAVFGKCKHIKFMLTSKRLKRFSLYVFVLWDANKKQLKHSKQCASFNLYR